MTLPAAGLSAKIVIAGGFGVGKTTLVGAVSEITPLTTEATITTASAGIDDHHAVPAKDVTTVAMDFGRITIDPALVLYLFGTPGQTRFWFMWDELVKGAIGAVILVDVRRFTDCFAALDYFEHTNLPFILAVNAFDGAPHYDVTDIREATGVDVEVPIVACDARSRPSAVHVLICLVEYVLALRRGDTTTQAVGTPTAVTHGS